MREPVIHFDGLGNLGGQALFHVASEFGEATYDLFDRDSIEARKLALAPTLDRSDVGRPKVEAQAGALLRRLGAIDLRASHGELAVELTPGRVLECSLALVSLDREEARSLACSLYARFGRPHLVLTAGPEGGSVRFFDPRQPLSPCYHCGLGPEPRRALTGQAARAGGCSSMLAPLAPPPPGRSRPPLPSPASAITAALAAWLAGRLLARDEQGGAFPPPGGTEWRLRLGGPAPEVTVHRHDLDSRCLMASLTHAPAGGERTAPPRLPGLGLPAGELLHRLAGLYGPIARASFGFFPKTLCMGLRCFGCGRSTRLSSPAHWNPAALEPASCPVCAASSVEPLEPVTWFVPAPGQRAPWLDWRLPLAPGELARLVLEAQPAAPPLEVILGP